MVLRRAQIDDAPLLAQVGAATFLETYAGLLDAEDIGVHCQRHRIIALPMSSLLLQVR